MESMRKLGQNIILYGSVPGRHPCIPFQGVNVADTIQTYILGKRPCAPNRDVHVCLSAHGRLAGHYGNIQSTIVVSRASMERLPSVHPGWLKLKDCGFVLLSLPQDSLTKSLTM